MKGKIDKNFDFFASSLTLKDFFCYTKHEKVYSGGKLEKNPSNTIKFFGSNDKLFSKVAVPSLSPKLSVIVPETHNAILIKDGQMLQTLSSGKYNLADFLDMKEDVDSQIEVLFMSKTAKLKLLWGTAQKLVLFDEGTNENYQVGFSGDFDVQIGDPRKCYLYLIGTNEGLNATDLQERLRSTVVSVMELVILDYITKNHVPFNQLSVHKKEMAEQVLQELSHKLQTEYGIAVFSFNIANIIIDSEDYKRLSALAKNEKDKNAFCPNCGAEVSEKAKFCSNCGQALGGEKICSNCGESNSANSKFCQNCGNKLE